MPLILAAEDWNDWMSGSVERAEWLLQPDMDVLEQRSNELCVVPVSTWVNDVRHDDPRCIEPAPTLPEAPLGQVDFSFAGATSPRSASRRRRT
jgi:putative SOS response-associated peptidase YedK